MGYKTDGSSHKDGIKNEQNLIETLQRQARQLYPQLSKNFEVVKRGGTQYKQDMEIVDGNDTILISAKKKTNIKDGSFDWLNSSSATKGVDSLETFRSTVKNIGETYTSKPEARTAVNNAGSKALRDLTSEELTKLLKDHVSSKNKDMEVIITETSSGSNWVYNFRDSPLYDSIMNHTPKIKLGRGKTSAKVVFDDGSGNTLDHGLRIRVVTNNGIGALIGTSKANKSSQGVVKIQQDNIPGLISGLGNKIRKF